MTSTTTRQGPSTRMLWSLDDLLFSGVSVWAVERAGDAITDAIRVDPAYWSIDPDGLGVMVNGQPAPDDQVLILEGPQDGLLVIAEDAVRASRNLANAWQQRVKAPVPLAAIKQLDPNVQLTDDEIDDLIVDWEAARASGGTAFIPVGFDVEALGAGQAPDLYVEGRNADRIDWANFVGLPAAMLDGSLSTATLTYSTQEGKRSEFVDYSLNYWASAVEARLSQDDVTPPGTYVRFDISWLVNPTQAGQNPSTED
ncbi:MAG: phage portal protein [Micropruina sp.]|uniref:phage portal protein n=1 Tax=Micropruina sp. TaxID=2737536 RepID=UPI0039E3C7AE